MPELCPSAWRFHSKAPLYIARLSTSHRITNFKNISFCILYLFYPHFINNFHIHQYLIDNYPHSKSIDLFFPHIPLPAFCHNDKIKKRGFAASIPIFKRRKTP